MTPYIEIIQCGLFCLVFFHLAYCFQDTCCYMYQYFIPLCYQVMFHFMDILHLLMQSSVDVHFGYFYFLAIWIILLWKHKIFKNTYFYFSSWELLGHVAHQVPLAQVFITMFKCSPTKWQAIMLKFKNNKEYNIYKNKPKISKALNL